MNGQVSKEVTVIQECNYKLINTKKLFEEFCIYKENLSFEYGDLRLNSGYIHNQLNDVFKNMTVVDMAMDRCDTLYLVDKEKNLSTYRANENLPEKIGNIEKILSSGLNTISAIGVDKDTIYIADYVPRDSKNQIERGNARLIALAKRDFQIRWVLSTDTKGRPLKKIHAIECDNCGQAYILEGSEKRILYINTDDTCYPAFRQFDLNENGTFKPKNFAMGIDGFLYVLFTKSANHKDSTSKESETGYILKIWPTKREKSVGTVEHKISISGFSPSGIAVDSWKQILVGEFKTESEADGSLAIRKYSKDAVDAWIPLANYKLLNETTKYTNKIQPPNKNRIRAYQKLISDSKGNLYIISDVDKNELTNELTLLARKKLNEKRYLEGTYISKLIDSQAKRTHWHRLLLKGEFPIGTQVDFQYYIADEDEKPSDEEIKSPNFGKWKNCVSKASAIQGDKKRDALFLENIQGQYLWFKLTLSGSEMLSPVIKSVTVFFPRVSYLDYLPAIYQEDSISKGLLERFLAIFESIFYEIDSTIDHIGRFFDAYGAPPDFLSWLGSWLAVSMDDDWPEDKKRLFISKAPSLYIKKGTREGLEESIELFTGKKPFIVERFRAFKACTGNIFQSCNKEKPISFPSQEQIFFPPEELIVKRCHENKADEKKGKEESLIDALYGTEKFGFCVLLADPDLDTTAQSRVRRIIEEQKPAHTSYELKVLEPLFYLDRHTYLEINSVVTEPKFVLKKMSLLGRDTVLHDEEKAGQIGRHSMAGIDTLLS